MDFPAPVPVLFSFPADRPQRVSLHVPCARSLDPHRRPRGSRTTATSCSTVSSAAQTGSWCALGASDRPWGRYVVGWVLCYNRHHFAKPRKRSFRVPVLENTVFLICCDCRVSGWMGCPFAALRVHKVRCPHHVELHTTNYLKQSTIHIHNERYKHPKIHYAPSGTASELSQSAGSEPAPLAADRGGRAMGNVCGARDDPGAGGIDEYYDWLEKATHLCGNILREETGSRCRLSVPSKYGLAETM